MLSRFRHRFRNWLIAWAVLRIVCAASPVAAALDSSFAGLQEAGARAADAGGAAPLPPPFSLLSPSPGTRVAVNGLVAPSSSDEEAAAAKDRTGAAAAAW